MSIREKKHNVKKVKINVRRKTYFYFRSIETRKQKRELKSINYNYI